MAKQAAQIDLSDSFEKIAVKIFATPQDGSVFVASQVAGFHPGKTKEKGKMCAGISHWLYTQIIVCRTGKIAQGGKAEFQKRYHF
ncbi:MAG: hypothetical protein V9F01_13040 [Chitinophagaceae bacterium]